MIRILFGSVAGAIAMFITGFVFWATPLNRIGFSAVSDAQGAAVQLALAQSLPGTGMYIVPNPDTQGGAVLYGRGPVATIDYNSGGFSASDPSAMIAGFVQEVIVSLMIALALYTVAGRVTDFASRAKLVVGLCGASVLMLDIGDPLWMHGDWRFGLYGLVADMAMMLASGLVIARWFVPTRA